MKDTIKTQTGGASIELSVQPDDLDMTRRLKGTLYQYLKLYERWSEDRQEMMKMLAEAQDDFIKFENQVDELEKINDEFLDDLNAFLNDQVNKIGDEVKESLAINIIEAQESIKKTTEQSSNIMQEAVVESKKIVRETIVAETTKSTNTLIAETNRCIDALGNAIRDAQDKMNLFVSTYTFNLKNQIKWGIAIGVIASILGGMIGAIIIYYKVRPNLNVTLNLSDKDLLYLMDGKVFNNIFPKLSKEDKDKINKLIDEEIRKKRE